MEISKQKLRSELLKKRKEINGQAREEEIIKKIINEEAFKCAKVVFCYVSYGSELSTRALLEEILKLGKTLVVPKCIDECGHMMAVEIKSTGELKEGMYGIPEPEGEEFEKEKIDLAIVPGIAFCMNGFRLGYGKGYYDRFLKGLRAKKIGICHRELVFEALPREKTDIPVDKVIY